MSYLGRGWTLGPQKLSIFSLLLALGIMLGAVEALFLPPLPIPGAKLGLANVVTLFLLVFFSATECLFNTVIRVIIISVVMGTFIAPPFYFSLAGASASTLVMLVLYSKFYGRLSLVGVSIAGAVTHNLAQLGVAYFFINHSGVFLQTPFLILLAIPTGIATGVVANLSLKKIFKLRMGFNPLLNSKSQRFTIK